MRILRYIGLLICLFVITAAVLLGFVWADRGCKKVGGYFDANVVFSMQKQADRIEITILNEKLTLRRF